MRPARSHDKSGGAQNDCGEESREQGISESFVKTMKRDNIEMMPKPDCTLNLLFPYEAATLLIRSM